MVEEPGGEGFNRLLEIVVALISGAGFWAFMGERLKLKRSPPAAMVAAEGEFAEAAAEFSKRFGEAAAGLVDYLRGELKFVRDQVSALRGEAEEQRLHRHACEAALEDMRRELEIKSARLQAEIDRLLRDNPPASW